MGVFCYLLLIFDSYKESRIVVFIVIWLLISYSLTTSASLHLAWVKQKVNMSLISDYHQPFQEKLQNLGVCSCWTYNSPSSGIFCQHQMNEQSKKCKSFTPYMANNPLKHLLCKIRFPLVQAKNLRVMKMITENSVWA